MKRHHGHDIFYKKKTFNWSLAYSFKGKNHGSIQVHMVLEKELRVFHLVWRQQEKWYNGPGLSFWNPKALPYDMLLPIGPHLLTPCWTGIYIYEPMGAIPTQNATNWTTVVPGFEGREAGSNAY